MIPRFHRTLLSLALMGAAYLTSAPLAADAPAKFTDRNEYDLVLTIRAEAAPQKRLALLDQWKSKYPKTELLPVRQELYFSAYQSLGDSAHMLAMAREMVATGGNNLVGLYWVTMLVPESKEVTPDLLGAGETAAKQLLGGLDRYFAPAAKPATATPEAWKQRRTEVELLSHRALGWIQWQRADYAGAEAEFAKCLEVDPKAAEISAWYGTVLGLDKQSANPSLALWHLARAASYRDTGALPDGQRRQLGNLLERLYTSYHGETAGLDPLKIAASTAALPPAGFAVESASAAAIRKQDEELSRTNPPLAAWLRMRRKLESPEGEAYFATLHSTALPRLKGTLLRATPQNKPKELVLGIGDANAEELILKLETALPNEAEFGTVLEFEGTIDAYTRSPFSVTVLSAPDKLDGWPAKRR
ncbi:MAG: hypothetical protein ABI759_08790 [Candidatus Solibacter sp.]